MSIWFTEELHPYYRKGVRVKRVLADEQTQYQHLQFVETEFFGNAMILDGIIQLTERDNMGYHEMIVHVPMLAVGKPKRVLIVGGGDGGSLQQVLRYPCVEAAVVCELDQRVVDLSRQYFAASFGDPWADPRTKLLVRDAFGYLDENPGRFDVIERRLLEKLLDEQKLGVTGAIDRTARPSSARSWASRSSSPAR